MNVGKRGARVAVTIAGVAGLAAVLAFALSGALWPAGGPARAVAGQCGTFGTLEVWDPAVVSLTPDSGPPGTSLAVGLTGFAVNPVEEQPVEILWNFDPDAGEGALIGSGTIPPEQTSVVVAAVVPEYAALGSYPVTACWYREASQRWFYRSAPFEVTEPPASPTPTPSPTPSPTPAPTASPTATPTPTVTPTPTPSPTPPPMVEQMRNCPQAGKWAIAVWEGDDDTATGEALAACGEGAVEAAYYIDPESQNWLRWFVDHPELSNLPTLTDKQGLIARGKAVPKPTATPTPGPTPPPGGTTLGTAASAGDTEVTVSDASFLAVGDCIRFEGSPIEQRKITAISDSTLTLDYAVERDHAAGEWVFKVPCPTPTPTPTPGEGEMHNCPLPGKWAIAVWDGVDIDTSGALSNCAEEIDFAYHLDPDSQQWLRWFAGLPDISSITMVDHGQALLAHAKATLRPPAQIAFASNRDGDPEIYVMNPDGTAQTRLTYDPLGTDDRPAWSPDRSKIAFESSRDGTFQIYVMNADGSGQTNLSNSPTTDDANPTWSPDGAKIAFSRAPRIPAGPGVTTNGDFEIYVMNADGTGQTNVTNYLAAPDDNPDWSPDGSKIAFESWRDGDWEIYVMNADGSGQTRLTTNPGTDGAPAWSPDGTKIAFTCAKVCVMNADGSGRTTVPNAQAADSGPTWSPDGTKIAFGGTTTGDGEIFVMNVDGSGRTNITNCTGPQPSIWFHDVDPAWSP